MALDTVKVKGIVDSLESKITELKVLVQEHEIGGYRSVQLGVKLFDEGEKKSLLDAYTILKSDINNLSKQLP